jgi:hypothetical protein
MGVLTKRVKRILQNPDVVRPSGRLLVATADTDPEIAVVFAEELDGSRIAVTVVPRTTCEFVRVPGGWVATT